MKSIETKNAPAAIGPYSQAIQVGGMLYTSGQIPMTPNGELVGGTIRDQTRQVLKNLGEVLSETGATYQDVIKTTIFLTDMDDFLAVNTVYAEFFGDHKPARSTVAVKTLPKNVDVEIECIARVQHYSF